LAARIDFTEFLGNAAALTPFVVALPMGADEGPSAAAWPLL
jgi:hypothetical protein